MYVLLRNNCLTELYEKQLFSSSYSVFKEPGAQVTKPFFDFWQHAEKGGHFRR